MAVDVTQSCNMRCPHCYAETFAHVTPAPLDLIGKAMDEFYALGVFHYVLQGGEPVVDPDRLEQYLALCHPDESYINVVTNGWSMTKDTIKWLRSLKVDKIAFSLDSGIEEEHDGNRLPGSFRKTMEAIDDVIAAGLLTHIHRCIPRASGRLMTSRIEKGYAWMCRSPNPSENGTVKSSI